MAECPGVTNNLSKTYFKEAILKKEGKVWTEYYAILLNNSLIFNGKSQQTGTIIPHNITMIEINKKTICGLSEKSATSDYRFPFWLQTGPVKYNLKCETNLQRYRWMFAIRLAASGKPPERIPNFFPSGNTSARRKSRTPSASGLPRRSASVKQESQERMAPSLKRAAETVMHVKKETNKKDNNGISKDGRLKKEFQQQQQENTIVIQNGNLTANKEQSNNNSDVNNVIKKALKTNTVRQLGRSELNEESDKKAVKWDLRSVFNYVNRSMSFEGSSNAKRNETKVKVNENNSSPSAIVVENYYSFHEGVNKVVKPESKIVEVKNSSNTKDITVVDLLNENQFDEKLQFVGETTYNQKTSSNCERNFAEPNRHTDKKKEFQEKNKWTFGHYDYETYTYVDLEENLSKVPKEHDETEYSPVRQYTTSMIRYRSDGDIEGFPHTKDTGPHTGSILTDRFGNCKSLSPVVKNKNVLQKKLRKVTPVLSQACRTQSLTSLNQGRPVIVDAAALPRRENSAPPLRSIRYSRFNREEELFSCKET